MTKPKLKSEYKPAVNTRTKVEYINCPLCGTSKSKKKVLSGEFIFGKFPIDVLQFVTIREGGGWKSGFRTIDKINFNDVKYSPEYRDIIIKIREYCKSFVEATKDL